MACVDDKGKLTTTAKALLASIMETPKTPEEIAREVAVPLFKVRSSLREMKSMGFVKETAENQYLIHEQAKKRWNRLTD